MYPIVVTLGKCPYHRMQTLSNPATLAISQSTPIPRVASISNPNEMLNTNLLHPLKYGHPHSNRASVLIVRGGLRHSCISKSKSVTCMIVWSVATKRWSSKVIMLVIQPSQCCCPPPPPPPPPGTATFLHQQKSKYHVHSQLAKQLYSYY